MNLTMNLTMDLTSDLASVTASGRGATDRLLDAVVTRLARDGVRMAGALRDTCYEFGNVVAVHYESILAMMSCQTSSLSAAP